MTAETTANRLRDISPSRKEIDLEVPVDEFQREYETVLSEYTAKVKLPGFRRGRAPREMVRKMFDHDIKHEVIETLVPRVLRQELRSLGLNPVTVPVLRDIRHEDGQPLACTASFEVLPDFELPDYRSIRVKPKPVEVTDKDVDAALEEIQARAAEYVPVEGRGVRDGDYVVIEMQGRDAKTRRLLPVEKAVVLAGHPENEPGLNERLIGMAPGEERAFEVSYPGDHPTKKVAGKTISYTLRVKGIKERRLPALDDEFARSMGQAADLNDLRAKVRQGLQAARERAARSAAVSEVLGKIASQLTVELPETLVEQETLAVLKRLVSEAGAGGISKERFEGLKEEARRRAVDQMRNRLVLERIAKAEGLQVEEADVRQEVQRLARENQVSEPAMEEFLSREGRREELVETLLVRKTVDFLARSAIIW